MSFESTTELARCETSWEERPPDRPAADAGYDQAELADVFHELVGGLSEQIALVDAHWNILVVNEAWMHAAARYGHPELKPGASYRRFCREKASRGHHAAAMALTAMREVDADPTRSRRFAYSGTGPGIGRDFEICLNPLRIGGRSLATIARYDVTELNALRRARAEYGQEMLEERLAERRRIAREIHDSTAQLLACIGLGLSQLKRSTNRPAQLRLVAELEDLLGATQKEIRSISYLSHPPDLDELGLVEAIRRLAAGFGRRTDFEIGFFVDPAFALPDRRSETALYRVVQEALSNVHRHARAAHACVRLIRRRHCVHVVVADDGSGLPADAAKGVGLSGMRARLAELDGRLSVRRMKKGTAIIASLPI